MNIRAIQQLERKAPTGAPSPNEAFNSVVAHLVEQPETLYIGRRLVVLTYAALENCGLVELTVVVAYRLDFVYPVSTFCRGMICNTQCICRMGFYKPMFFPCVFGEVPFGFPDWDIQLLS